MGFLRAPSNFLVQRFRNFDSEDLGAEDLGKEFSRTANFLTKNLRIRSLSQTNA